MNIESNNGPRVGESHERTFTVKEKNCVEFSEKGVPPILSTPWLIWSLEHAAYDLLDEHLPEDKMSLGIHVDIEHLAATPLGQEVTCKAKVIHIDRSVINFQVEAYDGKELISKGVHKRKIVRTAQFLQAIQKKNEA